MNKIYVVVRDDLDPGDQLAQAVHAAFAYGNTDPQGVDAWIHGENNVVVLAVPSEQELARLAAKIHADMGALHVEIREPDLADELTAIAVEQSAERLLSSLPLALGRRLLERRFRPTG